MNCPGSEQAAAYADGRLDAAEAARYLEHCADCDDCRRMGEVLTYLRETYPSLRVYSFDYHLDLSALATLERLRKVNGTLPALVINNRAPVYGFKNLDEMQALIPELKTLATTTSQQ
jgi:anti-sigma factor RsiW